MPAPIAPLSAPSPTTALQFVTAAGELTREGSAYGVDRDLAQALYVDMRRARALDQEALALQRQGELSLWLQCWGQEAAQVGSIRALREDDHVFPSYREHAAALCRGITPGELLAQWRGTTHAGWVPDHRAFHFYTLVLGTQTLHATGYAMGCELAGGDELTAVYFGDGAASQGDVNEALNWAAARSVPVLFICQNNQWAISTPAGEQTGSPLHRRAAGFGLASWYVDGNDVLAVHAITSAAAAFVRSGQGPAFVEADTFRMAGHSTSDDPGRYRAAGEVDVWEARDPIRRVATLLAALGVEPAWFDAVEEEAQAVAQETRAACRALPAPDLSGLFDQVFVDPHPVIQREKQAFDDHQRRLAEVSIR
ncbi:thiamine pyrophosphate-dependent dehydrogenase E1 component subunit alpha [Amycolatopsis pithecellobii]|uniref:2-oxoisovalerate dehydrogenase subunit alpha n=1 Tax=Amycolatopsis pithecellobii TaxID=664692 RepID=A0A6N7Z6D8_9PSEU|nr:thiamine pyrophosphate-dependent enzyme [Amycolatopsis pithecellobii]MTD57449.1 pyruvate dehydrogenase (acetyl-transferring) E1 component subunit alpha [Amycolatopsis pithecellobii]